MDLLKAQAGWWGRAEGTTEVQSAKEWDNQPQGEWNEVGMLNS